MIARARLVLCDPEPRRPIRVAASASLDELLGEFPSIELTLTRHARPEGDVVVDAREWRSVSCDLHAYDELVAPRLERGARTLDVRAQPEAAARDALEILTRYQRFVERRNDASAAGAFGRVLERHRAMHDLSKPLVHADFDHALDAWQWTLRLDPDASLALQLAAVLHDVERLNSVSDTRLEHRAPDYIAHKQAHARGSADLARALLADAGLDRETREETVWLVAHHESPRDLGDAADGQRAHALELLNDADALSFFSLNSPEFVDCFGLDHARRKVQHTLSRMSPRARARLSRVRLRSDLARILAEAVA
jgi:hypothetical protein